MLVPTSFSKSVKTPHTTNASNHSVKAAGCTAVEVKAWPNHYGVIFQREANNTMQNVVSLGFLLSGRVKTRMDEGCVHDQNMRVECIEWSNTSIVGWTKR